MREGDLKDRDTQYKILNGLRPEQKRHLCEKGILQKLNSIYDSQGLFYSIFNGFEKLKQKYKGEYFILSKSLKRKDGIDYTEDIHNIKILA